MTLQEFFNLLTESPFWLVAYFLLIPFTALLAGILGKGEGHLEPWTYLYSVLIYLVCIPGIFAVTLSLYVFIFERRSIFQTDIYTQVLPVLSMVATLVLIRKNVDLKYVPGFDKITGLIMMIFALFALFWVMDKTRIWVVSYLPFWQGILIFVALLLLLKWGWGRLAQKG
ncbi:MAG TPA: hypothetical protein ENJ20_04365 [Bacteroidetes bacterium]|nr:hypothetical protein [Bacteroidota bacterium]